MGQTVIATVVSSNKPLPGQKNRSSQNFSYMPLPVGTSSVTYKITAGANPQNIYFSVMQDRTMAGDPYIFRKIGDGFTTNDLTDTSDLYIANPEGATGEFVVTVYANN